MFTLVADPVGAGNIESLAHPGGNTTGFLNFDYSISAKWLELLKEIAPRLKQVAVLRDPALAVVTAQFAAIQASVRLVADRVGRSKTRACPNWRTV